MTLIRELRLARGWTQRQLAQQAGCTDKHISRLENGLQRPSYEMLHAVARALGISDADLLADYIGGVAPAPNTTRALTSH